MPQKKQKISLDSRDKGFNYFSEIFVEKISKNEDNYIISNEISPPNCLSFCKFRIEKKGRAGKIITVLYDLDFTGDLEVICKGIKQNLGIGGQVVQHNLELSGDVRQRLSSYLEKNFKTNIKGW